MAFVLKMFFMFVCVLPGSPAGWFAESARILGVFSVPSVSHQCVYLTLMKELARRGHELVVITPTPTKDHKIPNYTEIDTSFLREFFLQHFDFVAARSMGLSAYDVFVRLFLVGDYTVEQILGLQQVKELISPENTKDKFDLVFFEWFLSPAMYGFAHRFGASSISMMSMPTDPMGYDIVGSPDNPSYCPEAFMPYTDKMTFFERVMNTIQFVKFRYLFYNDFLPRQDEIVRRHFGPSVPKLEELIFNTSMFFNTYDPSFHPPRPVVPAVLQIHSLHIKPPKPLPKDVKKFIDDAPKGVVYMSLGGNARSDRLDGNKRKAILDVFTELKDYHFLWKWESDSLPGKPDNVKIKKYFPQQDILRHPKTKAFISQAGLQSVEEAIHFAVPIVGIPLLADQDHNINRIVEKGFGLKVDLSEISKEKLLGALKAVLNDKRYKKSAEQMSAISKDEQNSGLERAVWWTEYVLRHKGAPHLRAATVTMPWYQVLLLDVGLFLLLAALLPSWLMLWLCAKLMRKTR